MVNRINRFLPTDVQINKEDEVKELNYSYFSLEDKIEKYNEYMLINFPDITKNKKTITYERVILHKTHDNLRKRVEPVKENKEKKIDLENLLESEQNKISL
ncbi:MAG: hypothetical protein GX175_03485 [Halanaerobiaceae bacterium]|nr:hypothetical protein [Halanaerobiaceae bacterium]